MSISLRNVCGSLLLCAITIYANTQQDKQRQKKDYISEVSLRSAPFQSGDLSVLHFPGDATEANRPARSHSSLGLSSLSSNRNEDSFWAMRGKRLQDTSTGGNNELKTKEMHQHEHHPFPTTTSTDTEKAYTEIPYAEEKDNKENEDVSTSEIDESLENGFWDTSDDTIEDDEDVFDDGSWASRDKMGITDYTPFYWGSNQNVWGKAPLGGMPVPVSVPVVLGEPARYSKKNHTNKVSGWESNQSFWGKRSNNGPFWVSRGKKENSSPFWVMRGKKEDDEHTGPYWIARGKRPLDTGGYMDSDSYDLSKKVMGGEEFEGFTEHQENDKIDEKNNNDLTAQLWKSRGRRRENNTFWVTRGKKDSISHPFWVNRGKKELEQDNPFWIARGKKAEMENTFPSHENRASDAVPFWIARGKKDDQTPFWIARGKKDNSQNPFWVARGKKDDQNPYWITKANKDNQRTFWKTLGKKDNQTPFWIARGKKDNEPPFWVARGKKDEIQTPYWITRGKKENGQTPFWISRGKKDNQAPFFISLEEKKDSQTPYWIARGKKQNNPSPFWVARGKKEDDKISFWTAREKKDEVHGPFSLGLDKIKDDTPYWIARGKKQDTNPYWVARGKKSDIDEDQKSETDLFWVTRGKKDELANPYWVTRGKKETETPNQYWIARGKKETEVPNQYWVTRGKKERDVPNQYWVTRGKRTGADNPFWISRGRKNDPEESNENLFWVARGKKSFWTSRDKRERIGQGRNHDLLMNYFMEALLGQKVTANSENTQRLRGKKGTSASTQVTQTLSDDPYAKGFVALRG